MIGDFGRSIEPPRFRLPRASTGSALRANSSSRFSGRWKGPGGPSGLQNRFRADEVLGGFDSHPSPPFFQGIRHELVRFSGHGCRCSVPGTRQGPGPEPLEDLVTLVLGERRRLVLPLRPLELGERSGSAEGSRQAAALRKVPKPVPGCAEGARRAAASTSSWAEGPERVAPLRGWAHATGSAHLLPATVLRDADHGPATSARSSKSSPLTSSRSVPRCVGADLDDRGTASRRLAHPSQAMKSYTVTSATNPVGGRRLREGSRAATRKAARSKTRASGSARRSVSS